MVELTPLEFTMGLFSLFVCVISIYVGLFITSRFFKNEIKRFLSVGIS
ncbi:MAG: hypothetical protein GF353_29065 [Candidatus Lokiarchaeota archaeon]|nr:hypothetical protein [Candidatus Lokiarchaeota archaeon]